MNAAANRPVVSILRLAHAEGLDLPSYATAGAAGMDVRAAVTDPIVLQPMGRAAIPTGLVLELPHGFEAQVRPRSGLALRHGLTCLNTPGTVDSDYRGEVKVILVNLGDEPVAIERGMRIAQIVVAPVTTVDVRETDAVGDTIRGSGGFGSTGAA